ncbi:MAG: CehA/McbA family metallohydrolase [Clostridia bacterium]|nr:CehA/McbA family metallohydrolase [Clostridia bacterium]
MKHRSLSRVLAALLSVVMLLSIVPLSAMALEASSLIVAWEYNDYTDSTVEVPATFGSGSLSHSSGDAISGGDTGFFEHTKWNTSSYWLLSGINTAGKSNLTLSLRTKGTATGPKNWVVEYSTDAGDNWKEAGGYSITDATTTFTPTVKLPDDAITENLLIRLRPKDNEAVKSTEDAPATVAGTGKNKVAFIRLAAMEAGFQTLARFDFTADVYPENFPTSATEGWGYLNTTASGKVELVSAKDDKLIGMKVTKWGVGHNWCMIFNTSDTTDLTLEADVLSSGTGPADWAVEYSTDLGETWVWVQSYHLANSTTKMQHQTIHLPDEAQSANLLVRFKVDSDTAVNGGSINKTQGASRINHVTLTGYVGDKHEVDPSNPSWPVGYGDTGADAIPGDAFVGWNFEEAKSLPAGAVKGWGFLANSITTGPSYTGGALTIKSWNEGAYWLLAANTTGYTDVKLTAKLGSSATGPRDAALEYSNDNGANWVRVGEPFKLTSALENYTFDIPDASQAANALFRFVIVSDQAVKATDATPVTIASGGNSKINMVYMIGKQTGTHQADPAKPTYPADYNPKQEDVDTGFINADISGDMIVGWKFEDAATMPAQPTECGWGSLSHITSAYCSYVSKALCQTGWTTGAYWQVVANTSGCSDMTFQMKTGSSSTGPKNLSLRYSTDIGETWVEFATLSISGTVKNYIVPLPDAAACENLVIRIVVADDESIKNDVIKNGGSNKLNNVAIYGITGAGRVGDPVEVQYPADWTWPQAYDFDSVYVPENDEAADVSGFTKIEDDRRVVASWGGNANYAGDLFVYGDLITANDRLDGQAIMSVVVGNENITPGFSTSSTNSTNYYLGSKSPCLGSGTITQDENGDGEPDTTMDEEGNTVVIELPTDDYIQMKVSTAKYTDLAMFFRLRVSNAGPSGFTMKYSTDGENFTNFTTGRYSYAYTGYGYGGATYDVSGEGDIVNGYIPMEVGGSYVSVEMDVPKGCENAQDLYIRLYADRTRQTPTVNAEGETVTTVSKISSVRIDTVELTGCPMIHPEISDWVRCDAPSALPAGAALNFQCSTPGAVIYYSFDFGQTVEEYDPANPPVLSAFPTLVKVWSDCDSTDFDSVKTYYYFTQAQVSPVKASPNGGAVVAGTEIKFSCPTEDATIRYSFDYGETWETYDPNSRPVLTEELLKDECTLMVMGIKDGCINSPISILTFTLRQNEFYNLYFGQLHSHTNLSDGAGSCEEAFYHAANEVRNLDFLAITDHSNAFDNDIQASLQDGSMSSKWKLGHELADKYTTEDFVGLYGYEMTWSNGLGHMNTYNTAGFQSRTQTEFASYATALNNYYTALKGDANSLSQFNHPGTTFGNFQDYAYYDETIDELITIIEVGNGEGTIGSSGYFPSYEEYTRALDLGWHVAPTNNQDNHKGNWGDSNTARSVVMADSLTRNNIYDAIRNRRVYATEDNDFSIYYTLDNYEMGTILTNDDVADTITLKAKISDPTDSGNVKVDVIVNGGIVAATKSVSVKDSTVEFEMAPNYSYYYLRLTQADGNIAVTAPVWIGDVEAIGVKDVVTDADIPVQGETMNVTVNLYNDEDAPLKIDSIEFFADGELVYTVNLPAAGLTELGAHSTASYTIPFTYNGIGAMTLEVIIKGEYLGVEKQYSGVLQMDYLPGAMIANVIVDGTHYNDYVTGYYAENMTKLVQLGLDKYARVRVETNKITDAMLKDCNLLIITAPAKRTMSGYKTSHFSNDFIASVTKYVDNGGTVILCGNADYNDSTACQTHTEINKLLAAMGATVTLRSDEVAELNENNTLNYGPVLYGYDYESKWLAGADPELGFSVFSACSVNLSKNTENAKVYKAQPLIWGNRETFSVDTKTDTGYAINSDEIVYVQQPDDVCEVVVQDTKAGGHIFLAGGVFMSDFDMETDEHDMKLNATLMANILEGTGVELPVTPIAEMRKGDMGEVFCIEGWVTNGTDNEFTTFFDTIYVQDETGGVTVYPYSVDNLKIGTKVKIIGYKDAYQDDVEIQVLKCTIVDDKDLNVIAPKELSCIDAMDYATYGGSLLRTRGTIVDVQYQGDAVTQLKVKDDTGIATIFIDGYIYSGTTGKNELAEFCQIGRGVSAVGMCFMHPEAGSDVSTCCFRVRNCDEIIPDPEWDGEVDCLHNYVGEVTKEATCFEEGEITYTCSKCGDSYTEAIAITCPSVKFDDLDITKWYHEAVDYMLNEGLMSGTTTEAPLLFNPNGATTRSMLVNILWRKAGSPAPTVGNPFDDVEEGKWYTDSVLWAYENSVVAGYGNGMFGPADNVTREQIALILFNYAKKNGEDDSTRADLATFPDAVRVASWSREAVEWAVSIGIISGRANDGQTILAPQADASRAEIASILQRFFTR